MSNKTVTIKHVYRTIVRPRRWALLAGLILIVIGRLSGLVIPASVQYLIDDAIGKNNDALFRLIILMVVVAVIVQATTSFLLTRIVGIEAHRVIAKLRVQVQKKVLSLPVSFFDKNKSGTLAGRVMNDVDGIRNIVGTGLVELIGGSITSLVTLVLLINISPKLTLFVLVPVVLIGVIFLKAFKYIRPIFKKRREIDANVQGRLTESLGGIRIIKGYGAEDQELGVFEKGANSIFNYVRKSMTARALVYSGTTLLLGITMAGVMWIGGRMIIDHELTQGEFISFALFLGYLIAPIVQMSNIGTQLTDAFSGLDRVEELMNSEAESDHSIRTTDIPKIKGYLKFENVSFSYNEGEEVLKNIHFEAEPGSLVALVGSSGSGKSTIAGLVASHMKPDKGTIYIDDFDLSTVTLNSYRKQLGMVMQDDFLFEGSIRENILFSKPNATEEELLTAVKAAYVDEFADRFENGLDTVIGERGIKLSGGQRQRVSIARAILAEPNILILDEATSSLDTQSEALIQQSLEKLIKGRTTVVIAHRLSTIRNAHKILVIENGEVIERGTHNDLIALKGKYYNLYTLQARI